MCCDLIASFFYMLTNLHSDAVLSSYEDYVSTLSVYFNVPNIESYLVIGVYELKRDYKNHTE